MVNGPIVLGVPEKVPVDFGVAGKLGAAAKVGPPVDHAAAKAGLPSLLGFGGEGMEIGKIWAAAAGRLPVKG